MFRYLAIVWIACLAATGLQVEGADRVASGLVVLYDFEEGAGPTIRDRSLVEPPLNLRIDTPHVVRRMPGAIAIEGSATIVSDAPAEKIVDSIKKTNAISVEAWVTPENATQSGPARIVSLSSDPGHRNFTLGQDGTRYDVRLRTEKIGENGVPSLSTPENVVSATLTHIVYTRDSAGQALMYLDGKSQATADIAGSLANWTGFRLLLANEQTGDRPWRGELHLAAVYDRALSADEVDRKSVV